MAWWRWLCFLWGARFPLIVLAPGQLGSASHGARYPTTGALWKRGGQKNHVVCLLVFYSMSVLIFWGQHRAPLYSLYPKIQETRNLDWGYTLWQNINIPFFSLVFSSFFWGKRPCENKTLHIYWTEPPLKRVTNDLEKRACCLNGVLFNMDLCCCWWWPGWEKIHFYKLLRISNFLPAPHTCCALHTDWRNDP